MTYLGVGITEISLSIFVLFLYVKWTLFTSVVWGRLIKHVQCHLLGCPLDHQISQMGPVGAKVQRTGPSKLSSSDGQDHASWVPGLTTWVSGRAWVTSPASPPLPTYVLGEASFCSESQSQCSRQRNLNAGWSWPPSSHPPYPMLRRVASGSTASTEPISGFFVFSGSWKW